MDVQDRFYGAAMREIEQGIRREDLWIKAMARSEGDSLKAKALYVDLLARVLSDAESSARIKEIKGASAALAVNAGRNAFYAARLISVLLVFVGIVVSLFGIIREKYRVDYANTYKYSSSRDNEEPRVYTNKEGRSLTTLTAGQCYEVAVARRNGHGYEKLNGLQKELATLDPSSIEIKYQNYSYGKQPADSYLTISNLGSDLRSCLSNANSAYYDASTREPSLGEIALKWPLLFFLVSAVSLLIFLLLTKLISRPLIKSKQ